MFSKMIYPKPKKNTTKDGVVQWAIDAAWKSINVLCHVMSKSMKVSLVASSESNSLNVWNSGMQQHEKNYVKIGMCFIVNFEHLVSAREEQVNIKRRECKLNRSHLLAQQEAPKLRITPLSLTLVSSHSASGSERAVMAPPAPTYHSSSPFLLES